MYKIILRIILTLIIIIIFFGSYLSFFGLKTKQFNDVIKKQIIKQDNRVNLEFQDIFIKLNLKERSFSLNTKDAVFYVINESQKISNIDILIDFMSIFKKKIDIKKIIINSKENKVQNLLKLIRTYKINVPILYLEKSVDTGNIIYNITINFNESNNYNIILNGKFTGTNINILGKEKFKNISFNFDYKKQNLQIEKLKFDYKNLAFKSKSILANLKEDNINISGDFENNIDFNLISDFLKLELERYLNKETLLSSQSKFEISLNNKFKINKYNLESKINFDEINLNIEKNYFKNYLVDLKDKIYLKNGEVQLNVNNQNKTSLKFISKYFFTNKNEYKDISLNYLKFNTKEKFDFFIDLSETTILIEEINYYKENKEDLFLKLNAFKNNDFIIINNLKLFNKKNEFFIENVKLINNFKIDDFGILTAKYFNKKGFFNDVSISKKNNKINLFSNNFDASVYVENILKGKNKLNLSSVFNNLNTSIDINIQRAHLDKEHDLKSISGIAIIKNNKFDKINLSAKFNENDIFTYSKSKIGGRKVTTIFSDIAKPFVKKFDFIKGFEDGKLDFTSTEVYDELSKSELRIYNFKLQDMPALTKLLSLASLQGIADLATGEGIRFNEFEMFFDSTENLIKIKEIYALGPAISILMEGYVEKNKLVSLRGTLVPATTINKTIAKIPLLGDILVGEKAGEGVFGVSFKIKGPPDKLDTRVNPIKTLTPRFITRTLEKIKKSN